MACNRTRDGADSSGQIGGEPVIKISPYVFGFDVGTSNSVVSVYRQGRGEVVSIFGESVTPSVVSFRADSEPLIGVQAKRRALIDPDNTVFPISRHMGDADYIREIHEKQIKAEEVWRLILEYLKRGAEEHEDLLGVVKHAVITVPMCFNSSQRSAIFEAAELAGLEPLTLVEEPFAAAVAYGFGHERDQTILVYHLDYSAFDICILKVGEAHSGEPSFSILGTASDTELGGDNVEQALMKMLAASIVAQGGPDILDLKKDQGISKKKLRAAQQILLEQAEKTETDLCEAESVSVYHANIVKDESGKPFSLDTTITRVQFNEAIEPLVVKTADCVKRALDEANLEIDHVDRTILVGGQTSLPLIRQMVTNMFGKEPYGDINPATAVSLGAAILGANLRLPREKPEEDRMDAYDVFYETGTTSHHFGIETEGQRFSKLLDKDDQIPCQNTRSYTIEHGHERQLLIRVFQFPIETEFIDLDIDGSACLGELRLGPLDRVQKGELEFKVTFSIDETGNLKVTANTEDGSASTGFEILLGGLGADHAEPVEPHPARQTQRSGPHLSENIQFTVFQPEVIRPQQWYDLLAAAHLEEKRPDAPLEGPEPIEKVREFAKRLLGNQIREYKEVIQDSTQAIPQGVLIEFVPEIEKVEFNPPRHTFTWEEDQQTVPFRMRASAELDHRVACGRMSVFLGAILLADIPLSINVDSNWTSKQEHEQTVPVSARPYRKVFASYSHKDLAIVEQCEKFVTMMGDRYLRDWSELRSGEIWSDRLRELIDEADVFQLFWSPNSMVSEFVRQEWEYALSRKESGFVRPVYWEEPFPECPPDLPPENLRRLHFQRIGHDFSTGVTESSGPSVDMATKAAAVSLERDVNQKERAGAPRQRHADANRTEHLRLVEERNGSRELDELVQPLAARGYAMEKATGETARRSRGRFPEEETRRQSGEPVEKKPSVKDKTERTAALPVAKVAIVHAAPVFLDLEATVEKACSLVAEAARNGASLVAFPETFIPAFPVWSALQSPIHNHALFCRLAASAMMVPGAELNRVCDTARKLGVVVSLGINERTVSSLGCLYNSNVLIGEDGTVLNHHRKIVPTFYEKLTWAAGDGAGLRVCDTACGRIGVLIGGENTNPLARYTMIAQGEQIHISSYPPVWPTHDPKDGGNYDLAHAIRLRAQAHSFEANAFNVVSSGFMDKAIFEILSDLNSDAARILEGSPRGVSMVTDPAGEIVGKVLSDEEGILYSEVDVAKCVEPKQFQDISGGCNRSDIFELTVDRSANRPVTFVSTKAAVRQQASLQ